MFFYELDCPKICIENPVPSKVYELPQYTQIVEPYFFGHPFIKRTCLWLKGLPPLLHYPQDTLFNYKTWVTPTSYWVSSSNSGGKKGKKGNGKARDSKERARFWPRIAQAMADQWG